MASLNVTHELSTRRTKKKKKKGLACGKNLPWIEKYRPSGLNHVIAHDDIISTLKLAVRAKAIPHLLFYGPPGTGKTSTILACAKDLYGSQFRTMVLELNASDDRGVDAVRQLIKSFVSSDAFFSREHKLVVLDEIDAMTDDAQAILRHIIEKYSDSVRFCLICNYISKINPALQSRCTKFRFSPLSEDNILERVVAIAEAENVEGTIEGFRTVTRVCGGDMRKAVNILQSTALTYREITEDNVYQIAGGFRPSDARMIIEWLLNDPFDVCQRKLLEFQTERGFMLSSLFGELGDLILKGPWFNIEQKQYLLHHLAQIEYQDISCYYSQIQLAAMIGAFKTLT